MSDETRGHMWGGAGETITEADVRSPTQRDGHHFSVPKSPKRTFDANSPIADEQNHVTATRRDVSGEGHVRPRRTRRPPEGRF